MIRIHRAADRFLVVQDGICTRHCFSAGPHLDPGNLAFGAVIGLDEHIIAPGAGFARHAHRGVDIVSWVLAGTLRHEDSIGGVELLEPGLMFCQLTGTGVQHSETNASASEPLRLVQVTLLGVDQMPSRACDPAPVSLHAGELSVHTSGWLYTAGPAHLYVTGGAFTASGHLLRAGDSARADEPLSVVGTGELLVCRLVPGGATADVASGSQSPAQPSGRRRQAGHRRGRSAP